MIWTKQISLILISLYHVIIVIKKFNHTSIKNIVKDDLDKLNTPNPQVLLTMDNVDNELNNLINNQLNVVKLKNNEKQFNVINTTNKKRILVVTAK